MRFNSFILAAKKGKKNSPRKRNARANAATRKKSTLTLAGQPRIIATLAVAFLFIWALYSLTKIDLNNVESNKTLDNHQEIKTDNASNGNIKDKKNNNMKKQYTFYSRLKDFNIEIPKTNRSTNQNDSYKNVTYLIQAGSFKKRQQAEQRLVELKLLGLNPNVNDNINSRDELWYRVLLGPFTSRSEMANTRSTLISNSIEAMVMERKL